MLAHSISIDHGRTSSMKGVALWALGIPIPIIILLFLFHVI